MLTKDL